MSPPASSSVRGWGPEPQPPRRGLTRKDKVVAVLMVLVLMFPSQTWDTALLVLIAAVLVVRICRDFRRGMVAARARGARIGSLAVGGGDLLAAVLADSARHGAGVYLGVDRRGRWRAARPERAVLILGPPRSGKSSAVITPAVLAHPGPVISTSTKPDVMTATLVSRAHLGTVWEFNPTRAPELPAGAPLRWSPVPAASSWDGALLIARSMVQAARVGTGTSDQTHWSRRAVGVLAPLLHAAAIGGGHIGWVLDWVSRHELDEPGMLLHQADARLACGALIGLQNTEARERSSILSAAADALDAYTSHAALTAASDPNFDADRFVRTRDTIYVHAPAEDQALVAPVVCGLLAEIRAATYRAHKHRTLPAPVLFALDEAANIAPMAELPQVASEGGGQGLTLLAAFQDLSQARARWGPAADGFITLFGAKLILPGVADSRTLETVSLALGEYDRQVVSETDKRDRTLFPTGRSRTYSTQRQRVLPPGDVANIPTRHALYLDGLAWQLLTLTPAHQTEPWRTLTSTPPWITLHPPASSADVSTAGHARR